MKQFVYDMGTTQNKINLFYYLCINMNEKAKQILKDCIEETKEIKAIAKEEKNLGIRFSCVSILQQMETDQAIQEEKEENIKKAKTRKAEKPIENTYKKHIKQLRKHGKDRKDEETS